MSRGAQRGQAAVESIGIAVLVALLLAAVSAWLVREVRPPERPPALIEAVRGPADAGPGPLRLPLPPAAPPFEMPRGRDDEPIGRVLRAAAGGARDAIVLAVEMRYRFAYGFGMRLAERTRQFLDDPLGELALPSRTPTCSPRLVRGGRSTAAGLGLRAGLRRCRRARRR